MRLFYRISDKSYEKPKLIGATKEVCLMNFVTAFRKVIYNGEPSESYVPPIRIIADNCGRITQKMIQDTGFPVTTTALGNAGSLRQAIELAMECDDNELIYFCEDDYLHLSHSALLLEEGIKRSEYVSLYDHPDKYTRHYNLGEHSKVIKTPHSHWRHTISTCMTFGSKVKTLKEDWDIWKKYTDGSHPHDHHIFTELGQKGRRLIIPIPGAACHTDLTFSGAMNQTLMEPWAIEMMIRHIENQFATCDPMRKGLLDIRIAPAMAEGEGWRRLVSLDALRQHYKL